VYEAATWEAATYDKFIIENQKKRKHGNQRIFLHKSPSER